MVLAPVTLTIGMTFENHGEVWELDHHIPIAWALRVKDPEERLRRLRIVLHYTNWQPMLKELNRLKSDGPMLCFCNGCLSLGRHSHDYTSTAISGEMPITEWLE